MKKSLQNKSTTKKPIDKKLQEALRKNLLRRKQAVIEKNKQN
jgi:hypothetical protein